MSSEKNKRHVCPWWMGYFLINPFRRFIDNPKKILGPFIKPGMTVIDVGCGMGYYSLPAARMVGSEGRVICIDLQERMLKSLDRRVKRAGFSSIVKSLQCSENSLGLDNYRGQIDVIISVAIVHEVPDAEVFFKELYCALSSDGMVIFHEPKGHVSLKDYEKSLEYAKKAGFYFEATKKSKEKRQAILVKRVTSF